MPGPSPAPSRPCSCRRSRPSGSQRPTWRCCSDGQTGLPEAGRLRLRAASRPCNVAAIHELPGQRSFEAWEVDLHGHRVIFRTAGSGPPVVLIHGMVNSSRHWQDVALRLAGGGYTVVAPDLIGHGDSATPRGDYSIGAHAAVIRDLLALIGIERATVVGHSLGGGIAMQFFYQFPQRTERLALVSSGGLGHEVSPMLRPAALPGAAGPP